MHTRCSMENRYFVNIFTTTTLDISEHKFYSKTFILLLWNYLNDFFCGRPLAFSDINPLLLSYKDVCIIFRLRNSAKDVELLKC